MLLIKVGVDDVTGKDVVLQVVTELPPRRQLHVDLIAPLHLQHDNLKADTVSIIEMKSLKRACYHPLVKYSNYFNLSPELHCLHHPLDCSPTR